MRAACATAPFRLRSDLSSVLWLVVYTWGSGNLGQLGHGPVVKSGIRNSYEELTPKLLEAFEGAEIAQLEFGATHSAARASSSTPSRALPP